MDINTYRWSRFLSLLLFVSKVLFVCNKLISTMWYRFRWPRFWWSGLAFVVATSFAVHSSLSEHKNLNICFPFLLMLPTCFFCINIEYKLKQMLIRENETSFSISILHSNPFHLKFLWLQRRPVFLLHILMRYKSRAIIMLKASLLFVSWSFFKQLNYSCCKSRLFIFQLLDVAVEEKNCVGMW